MAAIFLGRSDCAPENEMVAFEIARIPNEENNERKICGRFRKGLSFIWMVHGLAKLISFFFFFFHHSSFFLRALTLHSPTWVCALQIKKHANHNLLLAGWLEYIHHLIYSYYFALFFALCTSKTQICVVYTHTHWNYSAVRRVFAFHTDWILIIMDPEENIDHAREKAY